MSSETVRIDGAYGEGGGQIIRSSVSLAALTGRAVEIDNIRARRSRPGLQAQHLASVRAAAQICGADLAGDEPGSQRLRFTPGAACDAGTEAGSPDAGYEFGVGASSAGATGLIAQTVIAPIARLCGRRTEVRVRGGTHVPMAPPAEYIEAIYAPMLHRMGIQAEVEVVRAGFFPRGGGEIRLTIEPAAALMALECVERGRLLRLRASIITAELPEHVSARGRDALQRSLKGYGVPVEFRMRDMKSAGAGAAIVLTAEYTTGRGGWTALGERGKPMERVADEALRGFQRWHAGVGAIDEHLADQMVLPCALIPAESRWTTPVATEHLRTALWVAQQFLPIEYAIEPAKDGSALIRIRGAEALRLPTCVD